MRHVGVDKRERERSLKAVRRRMLRYVCRIFRHHRGGRPEQWDVYMQRSAKQGDDISNTFRIEDWVVQFKKKEMDLCRTNSKAN